MEDPLKILQLQKTVKFGTKTIVDTEPKIWNLIPENIKNVSPFNNFKEKNKFCNADLFPCRIRKTCILRVGFI